MMLIIHFCGSSEKMSETLSTGLSHVRLFGTQWVQAHQPPLSMEFSRQEYCSGLEFPSPEDLPDPGIKLRSCTLQEDSLPSEPVLYL